MPACSRAMCKALKPTLLIKPVSAPIAASLATWSSLPSRAAIISGVWLKGLRKSTPYWSTWRSIAWFFQFVRQKIFLVQELHTLVRLLGRSKSLLCQRMHAVVVLIHQGVFKQEQLGLLVVVFEGLPLQSPQGLAVQHLPGYGLELEDLGADRVGLLLLPLQFEPARFLTPFV